jgi:hypothetical protein
LFKWTAKSNFDGFGETSKVKREEVELDLEPMVINTSVAPAFILNRDIFPDLFVDWWSASAAWYED